IRRVAGCATPTSSAGHAGATASLKLTFHLDHSAEADELCCFRSEAMQHQARIHRRQLVSRLLADRGDMLVVSGLGLPTYDCAAAGDHPLNFYVCGARWAAP